jgi:hypothetical protein
MNHTEFVFHRFVFHRFVFIDDLDLNQFLTVHGLRPRTDILNRNLTLNLNPPRNDLR